jgi:hypothetical protein
MTLLSLGDLSFGKSYTRLTLVFTPSVFVAGGAHLVRFEEQDLRTALARVDFGWQRRGVAEFQCHKAFPFRLKGCHVNDDAAARIRAFTQTNRQQIARNAEILHRPRQCKAVGRDDAAVTLKIHKALFVEVFRVHHGAVDVGKHLELRRAANVVAITAGAVADNLLPILLPHLPRLIRLNHAVLLCEFADLVVS